MDKQVFLEKMHQKQQRHGELWALLEKNYPEAEAAEIKKRISQFFLEKLTQNLGIQAEEEGWTNETYSEWAQAHLRAKLEN
jgi:hypothetical protein